MKYTFFLLLTLSFFCCKNPSTNAGITNIDVQQFEEMRVNKNVVVLDVRTPAEIAQGTVQNAVIIDIKGTDFDKKIEALDKSKTYLVYCKAGGRSAKACSKMSEQGFPKLYNLKGGYTAWAKAKQ